jgi:hypothetical protein
VFFRWERHRLLSLLPPLAVLAAPPLGIALAPVVLDFRFRLHRAEYESVAREVVDGTYPAELLPEHRYLALGVRREPLPGALFVVAGCFAGHRGLFYAADSASLTRRIAGTPWHVLQRLSQHWAIVQD